MFSLHRPSAHDIEVFLEASARLPLSYDPVGLANTAAASFRVDEAVASIGTGTAVFERAKGALKDWVHFDLGWTDLYPKRASIEPGSVVAVLIRHLGFWSLNGCRVVYGIGDADANDFGFAYGTLASHAECGEEIFKVAISPDTGEVTYTIRAASKPRAALAKLGYPVVRFLQARFRRDSGRAMQRAVA